MRILTLPAMLKRYEPVSCCFKSAMLPVHGMIIYLYMHALYGIIKKGVKGPDSLKHGYTPVWILLDEVVCCCSLWGSATLPRLLMPYLLLIRMSCFSTTICCSWSTNPLPTVWCRRGAQQPVHDVPAPDIKRPFCFVVSFFFSFWKKINKSMILKKSLCFYPDCKI